MRLFKSFATVGGATIASRILGFLREIMIAALLGAGPVADAFYAAFRFPNLFRRLFAEGAFNTAFIPLFAKELESGGKQAAEAFVRKIFSVLLVTLLVLTALAELSMPFLVRTIVAPGFGEGTAKQELTILLTRIMFPYLLCMSLVAMLSGVLNSFRKYFVAAFVPVLLNIIMIGVLAYCLWQETGNSPLTGEILAWGVFAAGLAQLALLWWAVRREGFTVKLGFPTLSPAVKRLLVLAVPAAIAGGITQINLLIGQIIASSQDGAITYLQLADRIYQLPLGVVGIAIGVVLLPELSRYLKSGEIENAKTTQNQAMEFAMFFTLPSAVALAVMPDIVTSVLYERGAFNRDATLNTADALGAFAWGLPAFVLIKVLSPAFFARENTKTPMVYAAVNAGINVVLSIVLFDYFLHVGIAMATTIAAWTNVILLVFGLGKLGHWVIDVATIKRSALMLLASLVMGAALFGVIIFVDGYGLLDTQIGRIFSLVGAMLVGVFTYFLVCRLTGAVNFVHILANMRRGARSSE